MSEETLKQKYAKKDNKVKKKKSWFDTSTMQCIKIQYYRAYIIFITIYVICILQI